MPQQLLADGSSIAPVASVLFTQLLLRITAGSVVCDCVWLFTQACIHACMHVEPSPQNCGLGFTVTPAAVAAANPHNQRLGLYAVCCGCFRMLQPQLKAPLPHSHVVMNPARQDPCAPCQTIAQLCCPALLFSALLCCALYALIAAVASCAVYDKPLRFLCRVVLCCVVLGQVGVVGRL
jgi:hypothetical protein